jgi:zinc/manganese transport system substrate-binding protein
MKSLSALAALVAVTLVTGPAAAELRVVSTVPDFATIAAELGGDRVSTETLVQGTQDPHFADARPSLILKVNRADLLIVVGMGLEVGWLPVLMTQARNEKIQTGAKGYLDASQFIHPKAVVANVDRSMGDVHGGGNPHFYNSPAELYAVAKAIRDRLKTLDPEGAATYDKRWAAFDKRYAQKTAEWRNKIAPFKGTNVVVYHESWIYLIDWLGFEQAGALEPKPGVSPSPAHVGRLLNEVKSRNVKLVFQEVYHPTSLSKLFADKAGAKLLVLPSMVGGAKGVDTIWDKFDTIIAMIVR